MRIFLVGLLILLFSGAAFAGTVGCLSMNAGENQSFRLVSIDSKEGLVSYVDVPADSSIEDEIRDGKMVSLPIVRGELFDEIRAKEGNLNIRIMFLREKDDGSWIGSLEFADYSDGSDIDLVEDVICRER